MTSLLKKLEKYRTAILLSEIGAYLHLLGRFSKEFIYSNAEDADSNSDKFNYQDICDNDQFWGTSAIKSLLQDKVWKETMKNLISDKALGELSSYPVGFCDFIKIHTWSQNPNGLCKILADAHGIVSGVDKALAGRGRSGKQRKKFTFRATAFGHEEKIELLENDRLKEDFFNALEEVLKKIRESLETTQDISYNDYQNFIGLIQSYYSKTIGETRRPINEISLFDYAHMIASLLKSNLVKMIVDGWYEPRGKSKWKILRVNIDVIGLMSKGLKIGDIIGYKNELDSIYNKLKKIVEYDYPIGNEIYRDSTGIYFSSPDTDISEVIEKLKEDLNCIDFQFQISQSDSSRSLVIMASEREKSLSEIVFPYTSEIKVEESPNPEGKVLCPVCKLRLKEENKDRCKRCQERYERRAQKWLELNKSSSETIWLDEVADHNDRVALIIGQFYLKNWLSGEYLDTFISQTFESWKNENSNICSTLSINTLGDLEKQFESMFSSTPLNEDQKKLCTSFIGIKPQNFIRDFWEPIAERDATGQAMFLTNDYDKSKYLIKILFRKHPSPGRIRRIWNTTENFIKNTIKDILNSHLYGEGSLYLNLRRKRIQLEISPLPKIPKGSTIDIDIDGIRLSPVCIDNTNGLFITTTNLQILSNKGKTLEEIASWMIEKSIKIKKEGDNQWNEGYKITSASPADTRFQDYSPYISIYDYPDQFMVLVPAYDALDIARKIFEEYEIQFSKVRNRLPFHLGIIAFHKRTPLYIAVDAAKRLIKAFNTKTKTIDAEVESINNQTKSSVKLQIKPKEDYSKVSLEWEIAYSTGDPDQEDEWHPYFLLVKEKPSNTDAYYFDYTGKDNYVVHVKKLNANDKIKIDTSYFKLVFLESASDRFRIDDNLRPLDDIKRIVELWTEIQNLLRTKNVGLAQLYNFWQETKKRHEHCNGDTIWENFVKSSLINILNISPKGDKDLFEKFYQATKDDLLDICLYWNLNVRKQKPKEGG